MSQQQQIEAVLGAYREGLEQAYGNFTGPRAVGTGVTASADGRLIEFHFFMAEGADIRVSIPTAFATSVLVEQFLEAMKTAILRAGPTAGQA